MLKLRKVAITGGLSSGKSSVCRILKELGAYVISADEIVHQLLSSDANLGQQVIKLLGPRVMVDKQLDRSRIAKIVFQDPELLHALEKLLHPAVYHRIEEEYQKQQMKSSPPPLFVAEIPLLFESGGEKDYDCTVAVVADPDLCLQRFLQTTSYDQEEFDQRSALQLPPIEKAVRADYTIMNSGSLSHLRESVKELYRELNL